MAGMDQPHTASGYQAHPLRIQRKRTPGWKMPSDCVYVGRPTMWGNPFGTAAEFRTLLEAILGISGESQFHDVSLCQIETVNRIVGGMRKLEWKRLACWCALDKPCHADVLAELANQAAAKPQG